MPEARLVAGNYTRLSTFNAVHTVTVNWVTLTRSGVLHQQSQTPPHVSQQAGQQHEGPCSTAAGATAALAARAETTRPDLLALANKLHATLPVRVSLHNLSTESLSGFMLL